MRVNFKEIQPQNANLVYLQLENGIYLALDATYLEQYGAICVKLQPINTDETVTLVVENDPHIPEFVTYAQQLNKEQLDVFVMDVWMNILDYCGDKSTIEQQYIDTSEEAYDILTNLILGKFNAFEAYRSDDGAIHITASDEPTFILDDDVSLLIQLIEECIPS